MRFKNFVMNLSSSNLIVNFSVESLTDSYERSPERFMKIAYPWINEFKDNLTLSLNMIDCYQTPDYES